MARWRHRTTGTRSPLHTRPRNWHGKRRPPVSRTPNSPSCANPDARRLFPRGLAFTNALVDDDALQQLGAALEMYGAAKHVAGRMDLFQRLFAGIGDDAVPYLG
jgi:hypothetical protein